MKIFARAACYCFTVYQDNLNKNCIFLGALVTFSHSLQVRVSAMLVLLIVGK